MENEMTSTQEACAALIAQGQKINAIKRWRTDTGCSLKEAKGIVEHFEETGTWIAPTDLPPEVTASSEPMETPKSKPTMSTIEIQNECATLVHSGEKISAIKLWRQQTDCSLKEAKAIIEHFEETGSWSTEITPTESTPAPEQSKPKKASNLIWWVLAGGIVVYQMFQWLG
jgi:ribosomal protein L7/L12